MSTSPISIEEYLDSTTSFTNLSLLNSTSVSTPPSSTLVSILQWILRFSCILTIFLCPWANYKLIELFQTRRFYKESSAKWYVIFKAASDVFYIIVFLPVIFFLTINIDVIHKNFLTCKLMTYSIYLSDDLISMFLTLLCVDRMIRITCGYRLRHTISLTVCIVITVFLAIINIHHIVRLQHRNGFCHKVYVGIWDYNFDIYYSFIYTCITWTIIFVTSINLMVSLYCDRTRRTRSKQQQQQQQQQYERTMNKVLFTGGEPIGSDNDQAQLIHNAGIISLLC